MSAPPLSSFTEAIFSLLGRLGEQLKERGAPEHSVRAYVFGGCAVHLYASTRVSSDLDVDLVTAVVPRRDLQEAKESAGYVLVQATPEDAPDLLEFDLTYNPTLGPLHEDFESRATELERQAGSPLVVWLPAREDVALTKLARLSEVDVADILALMNSPHASWKVLSQLTQDVEQYYVGRRGDLASKLAYVIQYHRDSL